MLQDIWGYFAPQDKKETPSIIRLPPHYPHILHHYNAKLAELQYLDKISKTLCIPPITVVLSGITIISFIIFGPYILNTVIIGLLLTSLGFQSLILNQQQDVTNEQYFITISSLILFSIYTLMYPLIDYMLDWIPFYYYFKFILVLGLIYQVESETSPNGDGSSEHFNFRMDSLPHPYPIVTLVIRTARTSFELVYAYTTFYTRYTLWTLRTTAFEWARLYDNDISPSPQSTPKHQVNTPTSPQQPPQPHPSQSGDISGGSDDNDTHPPTLALTDSEIYEMIDEADFSDFMKEVDELSLVPHLSQATSLTTTSSTTLIATESISSSTAATTTPTAPDPSILFSDDHDGDDDGMQVSVPTLDVLEEADGDTPLQTREGIDSSGVDHGDSDIDDNNSNPKSSDLVCPAYGSLFSEKSLDDTLHDDYYSSLISDQPPSRQDHGNINPYDQTDIDHHMTDNLSGDTFSPRNSGRTDEWCVVDDSLPKVD